MKQGQQQEYQDIFIKAERNGKKKGGSLGAVFKLIQELADFEEKIQECADAQEMAENSTKIAAFLDQMDGMYDTLFEMARGGIGAVRSNRSELADEVEDVEEQADSISEGSPRSPAREPVTLNIPTTPKM